MAKITQTVYFLFLFSVQLFFALFLLRSKYPIYKLYDAVDSIVVAWSVLKHVQIVMLNV